MRISGMAGFPWTTPQKSNLVAGRYLSGHLFLPLKFSQEINDYCLTKSAFRVIDRTPRKGVLGLKIKRIPRNKELLDRNLRVCAYARVSTDSDEQEDSLENQTNHYRALILSHPGWEFAGIYSDSGISGYYDSRKGFQVMLQDARARKFDMILVKSVSRFARNTCTLLETTRELKSLGIAVYFELQDINTLTAAGELMLTIKGAFAQGESDDASQLAKMTVRRKFSNYQRSPASDRTYGFKTGSDGEICVNEKEATVVRQIFALAERGVWASKIKEYLNRKHIPAPAGGKWDDTGIARILHNVMYKGDLILQKTVKDQRRISRPNRGEADQWYIKGNHPAIVSCEQWEVVQEVLRKRRVHLDTPLPAPPAQPRSAHTHYPLSNLLYCPYCGGKLIHKWSNRKREYWACRTNVKVSASACKGIWLPADVTDAWVGITEPVTVIQYEDEYHMKRFTAIPKVEYESSPECKY